MPEYSTSHCKNAFTLLLSCVNTTEHHLRKERTSNPTCCCSYGTPLHEYRRWHCYIYSLASVFALKIIRHVSTISSISSAPHQK
ncbi:hypothetical protein EUGRSUZ_A02315 [Eucalyptus grandis]|uniref:Uncharacterized protein n=2 Tax=Eucalyptus grandis TaxID=71139 RepID=A0ACC3M753_EUCGR|nr:hypothetical protein EUGRSUZ_A02315 [Eucalyptus grandis]